MDPSIRAVLAVLLALGGPIPAGAQVRTAPVGELVPSVGGPVGAVGRASISGQGPSLNHSGPSLLPSLSVPVSPSLTNGPAVKTAAVGPGAAPVHGGSLALPVPAVKGIAEKAKAVPGPGGEIGRTVPSVAPDIRGRAANPAAQGGRRRGADASEAAADGGMFDGSAPRTGVFSALLGGVRSLFARPNIVPAFPGAEGAKVRVDGKTFTLGRFVSQDGESVLYENARFGGDGTVRLFKPGFDKTAFFAEVSALKELAQTDVPHLKLHGADRDLGVIVQYFWQKENLAGELARGPLRASQIRSLIDTAARLIRLGKTADLAPETMIWYRHWQRWHLGKAAGFRNGSPREVLVQLLGKGFPKEGGYDAAAFLEGLRGRLGDDSAVWAGTVSSIEADPALKAALGELARRDAARGPPLTIAFEAEAPDAVFDDSIVTLREMRKRLGYDPRSVERRINLHADDPGKLNTTIVKLEPKGKPPRVQKDAEARIISNEVFMRKVVRRWFARYFRTPGSFAFLKGYDSFMVMEVGEGGPSWAKSPMTKEARAALAVLVHTFGVGDVNPGNILYGGARPTLIDFEQAVGRRTPSPSRIHGAGIILELPWVNTGGRVDMRDYSGAIRAWKAELAKTGTKGELLRMLKESGFTDEESAYYLDVFEANAADLSWTVQADIDYANEELER